jgi:hypothetical protein
LLSSATNPRLLVFGIRETGALTDFHRVTST